MDYAKHHDTIVLRLDPGDEVLACLRRLVQAEGIRLATIQGLGACSEAELALYDLATESFNQQTFEEPLEMTSIDGNITEMAGKAYLHVHATFGRADQSMLGGHLNRAVISGTAEIFIRVIDGAVDREKSEETGLNVFRF